MYITSNYLARSDKNKCNFYMLYEDYIQTQMSFMKDLPLLLQRFARDLGDDADLIVPFVEDIREINLNILKRNWTEDQLKIIKSTPGMLMINVSFSKFDPQKNDWIYFSFNGENNLKEIEKLLKELSKIVKKDNCDIFKEVSNLKKKQKLKKLVDTIDVSPQIKGIGIDLKEAIKLIKEIKTA